MKDFAVGKRSENALTVNRYRENSGNTLVFDIYSPSKTENLPFIQRKSTCACGGGCPGCQAQNSNLPISQPNDASEKEADAVADKVMRMPTHSVGNEKVQLKPISFSQLQRKCVACDGEEKMQLKESGNAGGSMTAPPIVTDVISSSGKSLDKGTQQFMESRMGRDFSQVQIHTDSKAAESAQSVNALAYTSGNHIVFNSGQYVPDTEKGKRLLAHELTHVGQQTGSTIKRKIIFNKPQPTEKDPIPLILGNKKLGLTTAQFNGTTLPNNVKGAKQMVLNAFNLESFSFKNVDKGKTKEARVNPSNFNINVSASMDTITQPVDAVWSGNYSKSVLNPPLKVCEKTTKIPVTLKNFPKLHTTVSTHENEHWNDIKDLTNSELKPFHDLLLASVGKGTSEEDAVKNLIDPTIKAGDTAINSFLTKLIDANNVYDNTKTGTHHTKTDIRIKPDCSSITIEPRGKN